MFQKKVVSVIITTYNSSKYIQRMINSILNQDGYGLTFDIELIVVDDCSTDNTVELLKAYNLILIQNSKNSGGPNKGRNLGLKRASGNYICIADHDDEWKKDRIMSVLPFLEKVPIVSSGYTLIDQQTNTTTERVANFNEENHLFFDVNSTFLKKLQKSLKGQNTYLGSLVYSKDLKNILFEENFGVVDFDWILRLFHKQSSIEVCRSLYNRYVYGNNLSLNEQYRRKDFYFSLFSIEEYQNLYPKETRIAYKKIHGSRARYFYLMNNMKMARCYFLKSQLSLKNIAYYITTYFGSKYVRKKFNIFG